jgi:hypothetical protein
MGGTLGAPCLTRVMTTNSSCFQVLLWRSTDGTEGGTAGAKGVRQSPNWEPSADLIQVDQQVIPSKGLGAGTKSLQARRMRT